jgi:2-desacetyl-2-hydroxyethyl bacteriochlorophyllide A dehydrogenase
MTKRTMRGAVLATPGKFELREVPVPEVGPNDALIRIDRCGICGTDIHIFNGHYAADDLPLIPGHELAGTIAALGANVGWLAPGHRVVVDINIGCGRCYYCRRNEILNCAHMGQLGITRDGAFAEFVCVPARLVIPAPAGMPPEVLALTEPVACVVRATRKARASFGQSVAIIGAGPVGNLHVQMQRLIGAAPIIVMETLGVRADLARQAGADVVVTDAAAFRSAILQHTDGRGVDIAIESVGKPDLYAMAFEIIRPGGHVAAFGLTGPQDKLQLPILETILREKSVKGSVAGMGEDMQDALVLLQYGRFRTEAFTRKSYPLVDIQRAFNELARDPTALKVQIVP